MRIISFVLSGTMICGSTTAQSDFDEATGALRKKQDEGNPYRLTSTAISSMMQFEPIAMGPWTAKMVAFGWITEPV